jgi:hypothetical protein
MTPPPYWRSLAQQEQIDKLRLVGGDPCRSSLNCCNTTLAYLHAALNYLSAAVPILVAILDPSEPASPKSELLTLIANTEMSALASPINVPPSLFWEGNDGSWSTFHVQVGSPGQTVRLLPGTSASASDTTVSSNSDIIMFIQIFEMS